MNDDTTRVAPTPGETAAGDRSGRRRFGLALAALVGLIGLVAACGSVNDADPAVATDAEVTGEVTDEGAGDVAGGGDAASGDVAGGDVGPIDLTLDRDDVDCTEEGLGSDEATVFTSAHVVVDGVLGASCFGEDSATLFDAWNALATITPRLQLADLGVFGAFESLEQGDEITLAFVAALDDDGSLFQMSVNVATFAEDEDEALLTMAHEFSHVFTALPSQIDRTAEAADQCATYDNGEGCYLPGSLMFQWIEQFWGDGLIDEIDPFADATAAAGQERCDVDPGFFGAYGASTPEEDFAESFSAFVFRIAPDHPAQQARLEWIAAQPGLAEFRDRADAAGLTGLPNNFDDCGDP